MLHAVVLALVVGVVPAQQLPARTSQEVDVRAERPLSLLGELGWNGLAGLGANVSLYALPHLSLDAGLGLGSAGWKAGLRARANLLTSNLTPFVGAGMMYASGSGGTKIKNTVEDNEISYKVKASPYAQFVGGLEYVSDGGFTLLAAVGYAKLLKDNFTVVSGTPNETQDKAFDLALGSGVVISLAFGYAFEM